jgi:CO/xanthine dehydrogenase Mo-binding subunit
LLDVRSEAALNSLDADNRRLNNPTMMDYDISGMLHVALSFNSIVISEAEPDGLFGAKGIGEPGIAGVAPAVANAVALATGVRIRQISLTTERVLRD